jgi:Phage terminase large subunit/Terminase RNaseH-like domain
LSNQNPTALFPAKLEPLFLPHRYKILYGGRGSGKSVGVARALLAQAAQQKHRVLCAREFQVSMRESVHKLLADQIEEMGLSSFYSVQQTVITGNNGSEFIFKGLKHNISEIKSTQGCTKAWVEEAQTVSKESWDVLIPTIREPNSEIFVTFNPDLVEDDTYQRFVVSPPRRSLVIKLNHGDNPWFPDVLREEMEDLRSRDYQAYLNVWEGQCREHVDGALWTMQLIASLREPAPATEDERQRLLSTLRRIVVAVDPSGCSGPEDQRSDEIGIVVSGLGHDGIVRVLEDKSGRYSPDGWSQEVIHCYDRWKADRIVAEKNFGGSLVEYTIKTKRQNAPVTLVDASRGKQVRAEPVAALYEQGKVKHIGYFPELERQMCLFSSAGYMGPRSPDRADSAVWGITHLALDGPGTATVSPLRL